MSDALDSEAARAAAAGIFPGTELAWVGEGHHSVVFGVSPVTGAHVEPSSVVRVRRHPPRPFPCYFYKSLLEGGAPLVRLLGRPLERSGYEVSTAEYLRPGLVSQESYVSLLTALHSAPAERSGVPEWDWLERTANDLRESRGVHVEPLSEVFDRVKCRLGRMGTGRVSGLHGDPHPDNIGFASDGRAKWFDLDDICVGPVAWDWSSAIFIARRFENHRGDLDHLVYAAQQDCGGPAPDAVLDEMVTLRELNLLLAGFRLLDKPHHAELLHRVRTLQDGDRDARWALIDDL